MKTKEYIDNLFAYETAYINTNHEDFIGFTQAAANTTTEIKKNPNQQPKNMVIRKGWLPCPILRQKAWANSPNNSKATL